MTQVSVPISVPERDPYRAAYEAAGRVDQSAHGRVWLTGRSRADLLQRLTTNDIARLAPGEGARTVLVNHHARILDLLTVYCLPEALLVTTSIGAGSTLARFLRSKIFFGDDVAVEDVSDDTIQLQVYGPRAAMLVQRVTSIDPHAWAVHHVQAASIGDVQVWIARTLPLGGDGFVIIAAREHADIVQQAFAEVVLLDEQTLDVLRIEAGYPAPRRELSTEYIPLETGLDDAISFTKGCYVGQEIIARMESRHRRAKRLMGLRLEQLVAAGSALEHNGKNVGVLTSVVQSPRFGPIGLAYIRTAAAVPGTQVQLPGGIGAEVVELPFEKR